MTYGHMSFSHTRIRLLGEGFTHVAVLARDPDKIMSRHRSYELAKCRLLPGCTIRSLELTTETKELISDR
jgi:hypothetical protein